MLQGHPAWLAWLLGVLGAATLVCAVAAPNLVWVPFLVLVAVGVGALTHGSGALARWFTDPEGHVTYEDAPDFDGPSPQS